MQRKMTVSMKRNVNNLRLCHSIVRKERIFTNGKELNNWDVKWVLMTFFPAKKHFKCPSGKNISAAMHQKYNFFWISLDTSMSSVKRLNYTGPCFMCHDLKLCYLNHLTFSLAIKDSQGGKKITFLLFIVYFSSSFFLQLSTRRLPKGTWINVN